MSTSAELGAYDHQRDSREADPERYRVTYGWMDFADFDTFEAAAAFYVRTKGAGIPQNLDRADGSPDARNPHGLTPEQREELGL